MGGREEHLRELKTFCGEFLDKRICTKNELAFLAAGRLHFLRKFLQTEKIPYNLALSVMERHQMISDDLRSLKSEQMENILHDIFYAAQKLNFIGEPYSHTLVGEHSTDPEHQAARLAILLLRIYDPHNAKSLTIFELKIALLLLCNSKSIDEIVQHNLNLLIDHNRCIHRTRFKSSVSAMLKLFNHLDGEINCDAETLSALVANSFANVTGLAGMSDTQFYQFWDTENRKNANEISYFFTLIAFSRALDSSVVHEGISCSGCNNGNQVGGGSVDNLSIEGVRFKCKSCSSFNLCTLCFLSDFQVGRHNATTHKFTMITEALSPDEDKHMGLFAKLLKVFYFMRSKRSGASSPEKKQENADDDTVRTIRFHETKQSAGKSAAEDLRRRGKDKLFTVIEMLSSENKVFQENLEQIQQTCSPDSEFYKYLEQHKNILTAQIEHLREIWKTSASSDVTLSDATLIASISSPHVAAQKFHSTPFRPNLKTINWDLTNLDDEPSAVMGNCPAASLMEGSKYIRGEELEKTYFEANRSNRSLQEISTWLHLRESFCRDLMSLPDNSQLNLSRSFGVNQEGMQSFRELLHKVRDILEDTYSDNTQLSTVTRQLETVLDEIIGEEERKLQQKKKTRKEIC